MLICLHYCWVTTSVSVHAVGIKIVLYFVCIVLAKQSPTLAAEDLRNDVLSNTVAIVTAFLATRNKCASRQCSINKDTQPLCVLVVSLSGHSPQAESQCTAGTFGGLILSGPSV